jgi:hypothetical protein
VPELPLDPVRFARRPRFRSIIQQRKITMFAFSSLSLLNRSLAASAFAAVAMPVPSNAQSQIPPQMRSEALALVQVCRADSDRLCSGVVPGGGRILACLQGQMSQLSPACAQAMPRAEALKNGAIAAGVMPK